jgi:hypothetical protein
VSGGRSLLSGEEIMTIEEIDQVLQAQADKANEGPKYHGIIFRPTCEYNFTEVNPDLLLGAWEQVKRSVINLQAGIVTPADCKAEALLLLLFGAHANHGG